MPRTITYRLYGFHDNGWLPDTEFEIEIRLRFSLAWGLSFTYPSHKTLIAALDWLRVHASGLGSGEAANGIFNGINQKFYRGAPDPEHSEVPDGAIFITSFPTGVNQTGTGNIDVIDILTTAEGGLQVLVNPLPPSIGGIRRNVAQTLDRYLCAKLLSRATLDAPSHFDPYWADFTLLTIWHASIWAKGKPDETRAKDPKEALGRALDLQPRLLDGAVRASGIGRLAELRARLQDILTRHSVGSDFVDLPNATFSLIDMTGPAAQIEKVDLGFIGKYSKHPNKKYDGERYAQTFEKRFRFAMALRTDVSLIQLGYRIELGGHNVPMIPYSVAPGTGTAPRFPTQPISLEIRGEDWTVYDVYQSSIFSPADEDEFEEGEPSQSMFESKYFRPERLFLNERQGPGALKVDITFNTDLNSPTQPFVGHATVTIRNLDPARFRGGVILPVTVYETRVVNKNGQTEEFVADGMTVHLVPSFLVVDYDYFTDRREGTEAIDRIFGGINERYVRSEQPHIPVGPEWQVGRRAVEDAVKAKAIQRFELEEPELAEHTLKRFQLPELRNKG